MAERTIAQNGLGNKKWMVAPYAVAAFLYWAALYLYMPTLPTYARSKADDLALVGTMLSMYGLWQAIVRLPLGIAADWLGRRKLFIVGGFALTGLGALVMGLAGDINGLIVGRAITGVAAATWVPLIVVFSGFFPPEEAVRASTLITLIGTTARVLATSVTGTLNGLGGYGLAFILAAGAAALAILAVLPAPERARSSRPPSLRSLGVLIGRKDVILPALLSAVNQYAIWGSTFGFVPILADQLGATDVTKSLLVSLHQGVGIAGNLLATVIARRLGERRLVQISFGLLFIGVGGAALAINLPVLFVGQFFIGLTTGIAYPVLMGMSIERVDDAERTTAMGLHQAVYAVGMFAGPWLSGILAKAVGIRPMFGGTAIACLVVGWTISRFLAAGRRA